MFKEQLKKRHELQQKVDEANEQFGPFAGYRDKVGILPDWLRNSAAYMSVQRNYNYHFKNLEEFNKTFIKEYEKELKGALR